MPDPGLPMTSCPNGILIVFLVFWLSYGELVAYATASIFENGFLGYGSSMIFWAGPGTFDAFDRQTDASALLAPPTSAEWTGEHPTSPSFKWVQRHRNLAVYHGRILTLVYLAMLPQLPALARMNSSWSKLPSSTLNELPCNSLSAANLLKHGARYAQPHFISLYYEMLTEPS